MHLIRSQHNVMIGKSISRSLASLAVVNKVVESITLDALLDFLNL